MPATPREACPHELVSISIGGGRTFCCRCGETVHRAESQKPRHKVEKVGQYDADTDSMKFVFAVCNPLGERLVRYPTQAEAEADCERRNNERS
jgi:hypothetical protein